MTPFEKSSKCSRIERYASTACDVVPEASPIQLMIQNSSSTAKVATPATIWFFVVLEMARPTEMNAPPIRSSPRYPLAIGPHSGSPYQNSSPTCSRVRASIRQYRASAPRNLPRMICRSVSGDVSSSSMVPERFSSANDRMVSIGSRNSRMTAVLPNSGRIMNSLMLTTCGPMPNWPMLNWTMTFTLAT